jgi:hypothetical protein
MQLALQHYDRKGERMKSRQTRRVCFGSHHALNNERLQQPGEADAELHSQNNRTVWHRLKR